MACRPGRISKAAVDAGNGVNPSCAAIVVWAASRAEGHKGTGAQGHRGHAEQLGLPNPLLEALAPQSCFSVPEDFIDQIEERADFPAT